MLYFDKEKNYQQWWNNKECLHDPKRFDIPINQKQSEEQVQSHLKPCRMLGASHGKEIGKRK